MFHINRNVVTAVPPQISKVDYALYFHSQFLNVPNMNFGTLVTRITY